MADGSTSWPTSHQNRRPSDYESDSPRRTRRLQTDRAAHVRCLVGPDGSRRIQKDRLDDQMDDQGASDRESDAKATTGLRIVPVGASGQPPGPPSVTIPRREPSTLVGERRG